MQIIKKFISLFFFYFFWGVFYHFYRIVFFFIKIIDNFFFFSHLTDILVLPFIFFCQFISPHSVLFSFLCFLWKNLFFGIQILENMKIIVYFIINKLFYSLFSFFHSFFSFHNGFSQQFSWFFCSFFASQLSKTKWYFTLWRGGEEFFCLRKSRVCWKIVEKKCVIDNKIDFQLVFEFFIPEISFILYYFFKG